MATIGLSKPYIAKYNATGTSVTYDTPQLLGKAVSLSLTLDTGADNILYADNAPAESDNQFSGGTLTLSTDDINATVMAEVFGAKKEAISASGVTTEGASWIIYDNDQEIPYVGFGGIIKKQVGGAVKYVGVVYNKVQFQNLNDSATTQGATIEWQVPEISATLLRSDNVKNEWRRITTELETEAEAEAAIKAFFGVA